MKRIIFTIAMAVFTLVACAQIDTVNIGTSANSGDGESLRSAFLKLNDFMDDYNGSYLYQLAISNYALTLTTTGATNVTLPTSGRIIASGDTASMLTPYIARGDTAGMLDKYITEYELLDEPTFNNPTFAGGAMANGGINIGLNGVQIDSISKLADDSYAVYNGADTLPPYTPVSYTDDPYDIFPEIHAFAGDTSNYATPDKIGDLFIDTSASKVYVSVSTSRGGWVILNILFLVFYFRRRKK